MFGAARAVLNPIVQDTENAIRSVRVSENAAVET
jgi:hypothetical protein